MKKVKAPSARWIVRCDGLKVGYADSEKEAQKMAEALGRETHGGFTMKFTYELASAN